MKVKNAETTEVRPKAGDNARAGGKRRKPAAHEKKPAGLIQTSREQQDRDLRNRCFCYADFIENRRKQEALNRKGIGRNQKKGVRHGRK